MASISCQPCWLCCDATDFHASTSSSSTCVPIPHHLPQLKGHLLGNPLGVKKYWEWFPPGTPPAIVSMTLQRGTVWEVRETLHIENKQDTMELEDKKTGQELVWEEADSWRGVALKSELGSVGGSQISQIFRKAFLDSKDLQHENKHSCRKCWAPRFMRRLEDVAKEISAGVRWTSECSALLTDVDHQGMA